MKRLTSLGIVVMFLFGCISFQLTGTEKEVFAKGVARYVGFELEKQYPAVAEEIKTLSQQLLLAEADEVVTVIVDRMVFVLIGEIDDPLLVLSIQDLISLIKIETTVEISEEQMGIIRAIAQGLIEGIELGG